MTLASATRRACPPESAKGFAGVPPALGDLLLPKAEVARREGELRFDALQEELLLGVLEGEADVPRPGRPAQNLDRTRRGLDQPRDEARERGLARA